MNKYTAEWIHPDEILKVVVIPTVQRHDNKNRHLEDPRTWEFTELAAIIISTRCKYDMKPTMSAYCLITTLFQANY